jgi:hypothetical protein
MNVNVAWRKNSFGGRKFLNAYVKGGLIGKIEFVNSSIGKYKTWSAVCDSEDTRKTFDDLLESMQWIEDIYSLHTGNCLSEDLEDIVEDYDAIKERKNNRLMEYVRDDQGYNPILN